MAVLWPDQSNGAQELRHISDKEYIHDKLGETFESSLSMYDTDRRIRVLIDEFLHGVPLKGKDVLDVGTGLGFFAERLQQLGANVTAIDIGENLLRRVEQRIGCKCLRIDALSLVQQFGVNRFDVVVSSECIEHTPDPAEALRQMSSVCKTGGLISVSTPNIVWWPVVAAATSLKLRPFEGLENFNTFSKIRTTLEASGCGVLREKGLHLFPFQLRLPRISKWCDEHLQSLRVLMINLCVLARKR